MRILIPLIVGVALIGTLVAIKASQIGLLIQTGEEANAAGPPPEVVASVTSKKETWRATLSAVGSVKAERGVTISSESAGIVTRLHFDSGDEVKPGAVLVELDTSVERAQLSSIEARLKYADTNATRTRALEKAKVATQAEVDVVESNLDSLKADSAALKAQIERKVIRAPFGGKLGIRAIDLGQYLSPGTEVTTLQSDNEDYVDFSLPQKDLEVLRAGLPVKLQVEQSSISLEGVVAAVDPSVNRRTRSVELRASTKDPEKRLRPGMFVNVSIELDQEREVTAIPLTAVVHAPYGDSIFLIEEDPQDKAKKVARQQFVRLGETRGDFVVVEEGLGPDQMLVSAGAFKLRSGVPVKINNAIALDPKQNPTPENR